MGNQGNGGVLNKPTLKVQRRYWSRAVFLGLTLMYFLSLTGAVLAVITYEKYLGHSSPVQGWLNNEYSTSYSTDIDDVLFAMQEVSIAYRDTVINKTSRKALLHLKERVDMLEGELAIFEPDTEIGQHIDTYVSTTEAMQAAKAFLALILSRINNSEQILDTAIFSAEEKALIAMRRLVTEAEIKELQARDEMVIAINSSRVLADRALLIGIVLFIFGFLALISVYWASKAWMAAERERFERLEYLLSTVGHDLRSPLQAIVSCAQLLRKSFSSGDNKTYVNIIKDSSEQLARLVDDLIGLARNEELNFEPRPVELKLWVDKITARFAVDAQRKGLQFSVSVMPATLPSIMFDEARLTQCVENLLSNAVRYTDSGSIKLTLNHLKKSADDGELLIRVEDTGPGIAINDRARIFLPFERASSKGHGKGLGLAIASSIVRAANGKISLETTLGSGSTFSISLPVTYAKVLAPEIVQKREEKTKARPDEIEKILIVDDDPSLRSAFEGVIAEMGYSSDQASDGEEGFKLATDTNYHAIITDIQMPGWDGFKLAQECRENLHPCPILIAITAYTKTLDQDPRASLFDNILYKPIDEELLLAALDETPLRR